MILAFVVTALQHINIASIYAGEIFYILYGAFIVLRKGVIVTNKLLKIYLVISISIVSLLLIYPNINNDILMYSTKYAFKYLAMMSVVFLSYMQLKINEKKFKYFLLWFSFFTLVTEIISSQHILLDRSTWHSFFPLLFILMIFQFEKIENKYVLFYSLSMIIALYGASRTAQVATIILFIFSIYAHSKKKSSRYLIGLKGMFIIIGIVVVVYLSFVYFSESLTSLTASNIERTALLTSSFNIVRENFWLGIGPGNFAMYSNLHYGTSFDSNMTPHNYFVEGFIELGIVGGSLILTPYLLLLNKIVRYAKVNSNIFYMYLFLFLFVILNFNVMSGSNRFLYSIILGATFFIGDMKKKKI